MKFIGIIPSRYASTRFPGKPLANLAGRTMIQCVYEQSLKAIDTVYVATDDTRIFDTVKRFGGNVIMTSTHHKSGTDRCAEALLQIEKDTKTYFDVILNIQGDEPFIKPEQLLMLMNLFSDKDTQIGTLVNEITDNNDLFDPNKPKVILNNNHEAIYFSRSAIPYIRNVEKDEWYKKHTFYKHIGIYAFRKKVLYSITKIKPSVLEQAESLEQLRWLENGYKIKTRISDYENFGIDTPEDLENIKKLGLFDTLSS